MALPHVNTYWRIRVRWSYHWEVKATSFCVVCGKLRTQPIHIVGMEVIPAQGETPVLSTRYPELISWGHCPGNISMALEELSAMLLLWTILFRGCLFLFTFQCNDPCSKSSCKFSIIDILGHLGYWCGATMMSMRESPIFHLVHSRVEMTDINQIVLIKYK